MKKVFAEIGFGNESFLSTEIEEGVGYGFEIKHKDKNKLKILFGISGKMNM